ncbi:MAG: hypothetical protein FWF38_00005, partial [Spirochaetaceae bacterium]|nr:hypothetical protein [Spirochaetaceae bacterium]
MKPGPALFVGAILWLLLGAGGFFSAPLSLVWFLSGVIALPIIIIDAVFLALMIDTLNIERHINTSLSLGEATAVKLKIKRSLKGFLATKIKLFDIYPSSMACQVFPVALDRKGLQKNSFLVFEYSVIPMQRGEWEFQALHLL